MLGEWLELVPSAAGLHVTATFRDPDTDDAAVAAAANAAGVAVDALSAYSIGTGVPSGLVFGYGAAATGSITPGMVRLATLL